MSVEWMDRYIEVANSWLWLVLLAAWRALPILALVVGFCLALRRKLAPSLHALLWTIVVARLLLPVSVGSPLSLHQPIDRWLNSYNGVTEDHNRFLLSGQQQPDVLPYAHSIAASENTTWTPEQPNKAPGLIREETLWLALLTIIISVTAGLLLRSLFSHIRFWIQLRSCRLMNDQSLIDLLLRECDVLGVGRRPEVREVPTLAAPAVFGLFRQTICTPPQLMETLDSQQLQWVIRHELAHIRRRDNPVLVVASLATACHWFNPIVWLITGRLRAAMESAADRLALQGNSPSEAAAYGRLLLQFAENRAMSEKLPTLGLISFASGKHLKQRVAYLMHGNQTQRAALRVASTAMILAIALIGLTDAKEGSKQKTPQIHLASFDSIDWSGLSSWINPFEIHENDGPAFIEKYDVDSIFKSIPELIISRSNDRLTQLLTWLPLPESLTEKLQLDGSTLIAKLNARQHQLLRQTLDAWRDGEPKQVLVEARILRTSIAIAESIDWTGQKVEARVKGIGPAIAARIGEPELTELIQNISDQRQGNILNAPRATLFAGTTGSVRDLVQRPFVTGVAPSQDGSFQPLVSILDEGTQFTFSPRIEDQSSLTLAFEVKASSIEKVSYANLPIRSSIKPDLPLSVQVPLAQEFELRSSVKLASGESVVVAIPRIFDQEPGADAESTTIITLTPRILSIN